MDAPQWRSKSNNIIIVLESSVKQKQIRLPYSPPRVECWGMTQSVWNILSSASFAVDFADFEDAGVVEEWGEASDM